MQILQDQPALLALVIFLARMTDVSLGTLRTIFVFRGRRSVAALIGFVEILIWIVAVSGVLQNLDRWYCAIAFAGGFAAGNYLGIVIESKIALGSELVRAVSRDPRVGLAQTLRDKGYDVIELQGKDDGDAVEILLVDSKRRHVPTLLETIDRADPNAFYTVTDVKRQRADYLLRPRRRPLRVHPKKK